MKQSLNQFTSSKILHFKNDLISLFLFKIANQILLIPIFVLILPVAIDAKVISVNPLSHGLPLILFNEDGGSLTVPANGGGNIWVPTGKGPLVKIPCKVADCLASRITPLIDNATKGLSFCGNFGESIWDLPLKHLTDFGTDPLLPILQFWRREGRTFFFSMRMNDYHHGWSNNSFYWTEFRKSHRHWFLVQPSEQDWQKSFLPWIEGKGNRPSFKAESLAYDYSNPEVREYFLNQLREACRRYDLDGVELDWLRYPSFFRDGEVVVETLNKFVREVHSILEAAAKQRGHSLRLVCRVPDSPDKARAVGLDVEVWLNAGWIDAVIAGHGGTFSANELDKWVELAHRYHVPVYGVVERMNFLSKSFVRFGQPETLRAAVATLWLKGADGLYFFNYYVQNEYPLLREFSDREKLAHLPKEYFLDANYSNAFNGTISNGLLPIDMKAGGKTTVSLMLADNPAKATTLRLELVWQGAIGFKTPEITLNGNLLNGLQIESSQTSCVVTCTKNELKKMFRLGKNEFSFTASDPAILNSLSVHIVP